MTDDRYKKIFSKNLKFYMGINHKTQMDIMNDLGLSSSTVSNWCTGLKLPRMDKVQMLADYLGIKKSDLLEEKTDDTGNATKFSEEDKKLLQKVKDNPKYRNAYNILSNIPEDNLDIIIEVLERFKKN